MYVNIAQGSFWYTASSPYTTANTINYSSIIIALLGIITLSCLLATSEETVGMKVGLKKLSSVLREKNRRERLISQTFFRVDLLLMTEGSEEKVLG